uniref:Vacuolar ATPase assembly protein VMA22 n=1 Tax=Meloidogyne enterolobii TaxID=390850 RepID=A0A6V7WYJ5_MELEN|nr:unnamed protein product [Meloidogyne enterolobii]
MKNMIKRKNEISIKRLQLCEQYFLLMRNVETLLFECHLNIAKTRKTLGIPISFGGALSILDDKIEAFEFPSVWIEIYSHDEAQNDYDVFSLNAEGDEVEISNRNQNSPSNDMPRRRLPNITETTEDEAGLNKTKNQNLGSNVIKFRPFGILEPQSARIARKNIKSIIPLLCDAANIRYKVLALDKEMNKLSD